MKSIAMWAVSVGFAAVIVFEVRMHTGSSVVEPQTRKPVVATRLFTGPDGQTHAEKFEIKLAGKDPLNEISEMLKVTGAEIHRNPPGFVNDWHTATRRQYVITLSGRGEIEVAGGRKIPLGPGDVLLAEDVTGKGHISRTIGNEDRVTVQLPLAPAP
jgi:mannose-6-phosphate isomerase-like protein (cupin superfamily)